MTEKQCIWLAEETPDSYAEFTDDFIWVEGEVTLNISSDYRFAAFVNGKLVGNSQFADLPEYKTFSRYDLSEYVCKGNNKLLVKAYHPDGGYFQCRLMTAFVCYEIKGKEELLCASSPETKCRQDKHYLPGDLITFQYGKGYSYSFTADDAQWECATVVSPGITEYPKPIRNTTLTQIHNSTLLTQGIWKYNEGETAAEIMQRAWLSSMSFTAMTGLYRRDAVHFPLTLSAKGGDGVYLICDLGRECTGYPFLELTCDRDTEAYLGWGEHLTDGRIRTKIDGYGFGIKLFLKKGNNYFFEPLRRMGCRYLCLFAADESVRVEKFGLLGEYYPLNKPHRDFGDRFLNSVYETGRRTLELCMHEHYEDCPWREQALYGMDSRNQMLFGYDAFKEYEFPRACLSLISKCLREDGLIPLCAPSENSGTIPSFSTYWVIAVYENAEADFNKDFVMDVLPSVECIMESFEKNTKNGVVYTLPGKDMWNFHEWSSGLDGTGVIRSHEDSPVPDGTLTALVCRGAQAAASLEEKVGNIEKAKKYHSYAKTLLGGFDLFFDDEKQLFASYIIDGEKTGFHEYTQSAFLTTGMLPQNKLNRLCEALQCEKENLIPVTLSGLALKYEGLLNYCENSKKYILDDIEKIFGKMLYSGATSFWETIYGEADFGDAGSLCHGWSAVACYVLDRIFYCNE